MIQVIHWNLQISTPKNKNLLIDTKASAYLFGDEYRICFSNMKQKYYFSIAADPDYTEEMIRYVSEKVFTQERDSLEVAKCIRCSKWDVVSGQFCERCKEAIKNPSSSDMLLEIET